MGGENQCQHFNKIIKQNAVNTSSGGGGTEPSFPEDSPFNLEAVWTEMKRSTEAMFSLGTSNNKYSGYIKNPISKTVSDYDWWCDYAFKNTVLTPGGIVYLIPYKCNKIVKVDTNTNPITITVLGTLSSSSEYNYSGAVYAPDGCVYAVPACLNNILKINPQNDTFEVFGSESLSTTSGIKWMGAVVTPSGDIYGIPYDASSVLKVNIYTRNISTIGDSYSGFAKWNGGCLARNNCIYCSPYDISPVSVLKIDTITDSVTALSVDFGSNDLNALNHKYAPPAFSPSGSVAFFPYNGYISSRVSLPIFVVGNKIVQEVLDDTDWSNSGIVTPNTKMVFGTSVASPFGCGSVTFEITEWSAGRIRFNLMELLTYIGSSYHIAYVSKSFTPTTVNYCGNHCGGLLLPDARVFSIPNIRTDPITIFGHSTFSEELAPVVISDFVLLSPFVNRN